MKRAATILIGSLVAFPAAAQTTNCYRFGNQVSCNTTPAPQIQQPNYSGIIAAGVAARQAREARKQAKAMAEAQTMRRQQLEIIAGFIRAGDCATAKDTALAISDIALAAQVQQLCTPAPAAVSPAAAPEPPRTSFLDAARAGKLADAINGR